MAEIQVLKPSGAVTTTGQGAGVPLPLGDMVGYFINVSAVSGTTPSLTVKLDLSADGVTWAPGAAGTPAAITAAGTYYVASPNPGAQVRASWTVSGTTPSFTFSVVAVGHTTAIAN